METRWTHASVKAYREQVRDEVHPHAVPALDVLTMVSAAVTACRGVRACAFVQLTRSGWKRKAVSRGNAFWRSNANGPPSPTGSEAAHGTELELQQQQRQQQPLAEVR
uniref:Uncharacterized protein n=1 Tax=Globodera pallida TaxID=36090 RepID=A0A183CIT9_GLOPA